MSLISISVKTVYTSMNENNLFRRSYMASGFVFSNNKDKWNQLDITHTIFKNVIDQAPGQRLFTKFCCHGIGGKIFKEEESLGLIMVAFQNGIDTGTTFNQHLCSGKGNE